MLAVGYLLIVADILFFYVSLVESRPGKHLTLNYGIIFTTAVLETSELYAWRGTRNPEDDRNPEPR